MTAEDMDKTIAHYADDASALRTNVAIGPRRLIRELLKGPISDPNVALTSRQGRLSVESGRPRILAGRIHLHFH
jgi:hypothetical protein